jgi:2,4-dienoyl-CoA reductase-like NADH-dependent reductase (Old Yellow Enzyme family)
MSKDPLLQPYQLKHLTLKNRIMITSHEPAYPEDGMPKDRYRAYHERGPGRHRHDHDGRICCGCRAGLPAGLQQRPGLQGRGRAWMKKLTDACHEHGCAVMIQLTHLGRRTHWNKGDWLPALSTSHEREPAHRAFPKKMEDWDIARSLSDYADAAERMAEAGLDGIELQAMAT